jgi:hypothetical protein
VKVSKGFNVSGRWVRFRGKCEHKRLGYGRFRLRLSF